MAQRVPQLLYGLALALVSLAIPRSRELWVIGSWSGGRFADNGKWFFLELSRDQTLRAIFCTRNPQLYSQLRAQGHAVALSNTIRGIWSALRAGVYVYDRYPNDVNFWAIRGAVWVQLWHGIPLKRIERDIQDPQHTALRTLRELDAGRIRSRLRALLFDPWLLKKEQFACCTSDMLVPVFAGAFGLPVDRVRVTGYPRNDVIWQSNGHVAELGSADSNDIFHAATTAGKQVLLYVPTFRDVTDSDGTHSVFEQTWTPEQQVQLDRLLRSLNAVMFVKLHPNLRSSWKFLDTADSIQALPSALDLYPVLNKVDVLITDYSSIYFDYLLLERPVIFYCYDLDEYESSRGFYFDYSRVTPGPKVRTFSELLEAIESTVQGTLDFSNDIIRAKELFHKYSDGHSGSGVAKEIRSVLGVN